MRSPERRTIRVGGGIAVDGRRIRRRSLPFSRAGTLPAREVPTRTSTRKPTITSTRTRFAASRTTRCRRFRSMSTRPPTPTCGRFLNEGTVPPAGAVRIEELINYFRFDYPQPERR